MVIFLGNNHHELRAPVLIQELAGLEKNKSVITPENNLLAVNYSGTSVSEIRKPQLFVQVQCLELG